MSTTQNSLEPYPVPPIRSGFPDFGPDPDFFDQTGPDFEKIKQNNVWKWPVLALFLTSQPWLISR